MLIHKEVVKVSVVATFALDTKTEDKDYGAEIEQTESIEMSDVAAPTEGAETVAE